MEKHTIDIPARRGPEDGSRTRPLALRQADAWQDFLAAGRTIASEDRDFSEWHRGRAQFALWAIVPSNDCWSAAVDAARNRFADMLLPGYDRQPHITLFVCGFPAARPDLSDDFAIDRISAQVAAFFDHPPAPFAISLGKLSSFASSLFFEINDPHGGIDSLRQVLEGSGPELRQTEYLPHLTVGLYGGAYPTDRLAASIRTFAFAETKPFRVERISLLAYEPARIGGRLQSLYDFDFV